VLGGSDDFDANGGVEVHYVYSPENMILSSEDTIWLHGADGVEQAKLSYSDHLWRGASISVRPKLIYDEFCSSISYGHSSNFGTPGKESYCAPMKRDMSKGPKSRRTLKQKK
jgi:hypothetical protein